VKFHEIPFKWRPTMGKPTGNHGEILSQNEGFKGKIIQLSAEVPIANPVWLILEGKFG